MIMGAWPRLEGLRMTAARGYRVSLDAGQQSECRAGYTIPIRTGMVGKYHGCAHWIPHSSLLASTTVCIWLSVHSWTSGMRLKPFHGVSDAGLSGKF